MRSSDWSADVCSADLMTFGATHTAASVEEAAELVGQITWGANADKTIITVGVGRGDLIAPVMAMTAKGGRCVHTSVAPIDETTVSLSLFDLSMSQKQLVGPIFGSANPRYDITRLARKSVVSGKSGPVRV